MKNKILVRVAPAARYLGVTKGDLLGMAENEGYHVFRDGAFHAMKRAHVKALRTKLETAKGQPT
jgi:hypothetical protein